MVDLLVNECIVMDFSEHSNPNEKYILLSFWVSLVVTTFEIFSKVNIPDATGTISYFNPSAGVSKMAEEQSKTLEDEEIKICDEEESPEDNSLHNVFFDTATSSPNSVVWSEDDRLAVITDKRIYILSLAATQNPKRSGVSDSMEFKTSIINNFETIRYDTKINTTSFKKCVQGSMSHRQAYLFDNSTMENEAFCHTKNRFSSVKWSPPGCTVDGRCVLATTSYNGNVYICSQMKMVAKWKPVISISFLLHDFLISNGWFESGDNSPPPFTIADAVGKHQNRKHFLFTETICWCPATLKCKSCVNTTTIGTEPLHKFVQCTHFNALLLTASRNGYLFLWRIVLSDKSSAQMLLSWPTNKKWPTAVEMTRVSKQDLYVAVGFSNGVLEVFHICFTDSACDLSQNLHVWEEVDMLCVSFIKWTKIVNGTIHLIVSKECEIAVFKIEQYANNRMACVACEIPSSCHATPITSLHLINETYVLTSSSSSIQYFDIIRKEKLPQCETNIPRGFKCFGVTVDNNMALLARVSSPDRLLLTQTMFANQMELSIQPFLSLDVLAGKLLDETLTLSMSMKELFIASSTESFLLPTSLHKYCDEPESYKSLSLAELRLYLFFNKLRCIQQAGFTETLNDVITASQQLADSIIERVTRQIQLVYIQSALRECLQNDWVETTASGKLILSLMADWLIKTDDNNTEILRQCYVMLKDDAALNECDVTENRADLRPQSVAREKCLFCGLDVELCCLEEGRCANHHIMHRCCLTLRVCTSNSYRRCTGCKRVAFNKRLDGQLSVEAVLLNVDLCPFCGGRLISAI